MDPVIDTVFNYAQFVIFRWNWFALNKIALLILLEENCKKVALQW